MTQSTDISTSELPEGVRALLARAQARRQRQAETRQVLAERRRHGLRKRHAAKLARG